MFEKDRAKLWDETTRGRAAAAGTVRLLTKTNDSVLYELLAYFLSGLVLFTILITLIIGIGDAAVTTHENNSSSANGDNLTNVYFLKHESRSWTNDELCNIEYAARLYPDYHIFVLNLQNLNRSHGVKDYHSLFKKVLEKYVPFTQKNASAGKDFKHKLHYKLLEIPNLDFIDVGVEKFFAGTIFSKKVRDFNSKEIELAGKFQIIWDSPGISLEPLDVQQLETLQTDLKNNFARIQINSDFQASNVPCQSFIGSVIAEILKTDQRNRQNLLKRTLKNYCSKNLTECNGVNIITPLPGNFYESNKCPITQTTFETIKSSFSKINDTNLI